MQGIYGYKDLKTGYIVYIGKDSYIDKNSRKSDHMSKKEQKIDEVLQKNPDRYKYFVVKKGEYSEEDLNALEKHYIDFYGTYENHKGKGLNYGFNFTEGGEGATGYKHTEQTKEHMSKIRIIPESRIIKAGKINGKQRWKIVYNGSVLVQSLNKKLLESLLELFFDENGKILIDQDIAKQKISEITKKDGFKSARITKSKQYNKTGFYRVSKRNKKKEEHNNILTYQYLDSKNKKKSISSTNLLKLKQRVVENNLEWSIIDYSKAKKLCDEHNLDIEALK